MNEGLDEGGVTIGGGDMNMADSWRGNVDGYFILLEGLLCDDDVGSLGGIIRERFLFLWGNINDWLGGGDTVRRLSSVSASFRHSGMYPTSHTHGSTDLLNHKE